MEITAGTTQKPYKKIREDPLSNKDISRIGKDFKTRGKAARETAVVWGIQDEVPDCTLC